MKHNVTPFHIREYSHAELKEKLLRNGFQIQEWWGQSNAVSRKAESYVPKSGIHRLLPKFIRNFLKNILLGNVTSQARKNVTLQQSDMTGAFVQIAVCTK